MIRSMFVGLGVGSLIVACNTQSDINSTSASENAVVVTNAERIIEEPSFSNPYLAAVVSPETSAEPASQIPSSVAYACGAINATVNTYHKVCCAVECGSECKTYGLSKMGWPCQAWSIANTRKWSHWSCTKKQAPCWY